MQGTNSNIQMLNSIPIFRRSLTSPAEVAETRASSLGSVYSPPNNMLSFMVQISHWICSNFHGRSFSPGASKWLSSSLPGLRARISAPTLIASQGVLGDDGTRRSKFFFQRNFPLTGPPALQSQSHYMRWQSPIHKLSASSLSMERFFRYHVSNAVQF